MGDEAERGHDGDERHDRIDERREAMPRHQLDEEPSEARDMDAPDDAEELLRDVA